MRTLVFLVNPSSGGGTGQRLMQHLRGIYGDEQVMSVFSVDVPTLLDRWRDRGLALIACGGDGTVSSVLNAVHVAENKPPGSVPVGLIPLGTGNDLARALGYRPVATQSAVGQILERLPHAHIRQIDRWILRSAQHLAGWYNYCSWGFDARIAWQFHNLRQKFRPFFRSRLANLACYAGIGLQERGILMGLRLETAAGSIEPPPWMRSFVVSSIGSYAGGRQLGNRIQCDDGKCDAFALGSGLAFGLGLSGWRRPRRLGTHSALRVEVPLPTFMQLDGEPMVAQPGIYEIERSGTVPVLAM